MRDPNRIPRILEALKRVWLGSPDQRLGQLLSNLAHPNSDLWNLEDSDWEKLMLTFLQTGKWRS